MDPSPTQGDYLDAGIYSQVGTAGNCYNKECHDQAVAARRISGDHRSFLNGVRRHAIR
jgi:hypothetical protein